MQRRDFCRLALGGAAAAAAQQTGFAHEGIHSVFRGVLIGAQSYSFRDRPLDEAIAAYRTIGIGEAEVWSGHLERKPGQPRPTREQMRDWRLNVDLAEFEAAGQKFHEAGVEVFAFNYSFREDFNDAEIERGFEMAKALGAKCITASSNVTAAERIYPFAKKHQLRVGMHNHSRIHANEFATPDDFQAARAGRGDWIAVNLDIGHYVAAGFDPVDYILKHHDDIVTLHIKDRKKNQGENMPFGEGETPIKEVFELLRDRRYRIPANIEYEYKGADTIAEVRKCFEYCKSALVS